MFEERTLIDKVVSAAIIGLLGWNVASTQKLSVDVEVLKVQTQAIIDKSIDSTDVVLLEQRTRRLEEWVESLSERLATAEKLVMEGTNE